MSMMQTFQNITERGDGKSVIEGKSFLLMKECENDFHKERLPTIPAGTKILADFACDSGMYGLAEIDGVLHRIKIALSELHNVDFGEFDARPLSARTTSAAA